MSRYLCPHKVPFVRFCAECCGEGGDDWYDYFTAAAILGLFFGAMTIPGLLWLCGVFR